MTPRNFTAYTPGRIPIRRALFILETSWLTPKQADPKEGVQR